MPTGYTSKIAKGISFEEFAMNCARAFVALVMMRDESSDTEIPKKFEPSDYHKKALAEIEKKLKEINENDSGWCLNKAIDEYDTALKTKEEGIRKANELREKYSTMLIKVKQWQPPSSEHTGLKDFMIEQIEDSAKFDCGTSYYEKQEVKCLSGQEWKEKHLAELMKNLAYHTKENLLEIARTEGRNDWIAKLRKSL